MLPTANEDELRDDTQVFPQVSEIEDVPHDTKSWPLSSNAVAFDSFL